MLLGLAVVLLESSSQLLGVSSLFHFWQSRKHFLSSKLDILKGVVKEVLQHFRLLRHRVLLWGLS